MRETATSVDRHVAGHILLLGGHRLATIDGDIHLKHLVVVLREGGGGMLKRDGIDLAAAEGHYYPTLHIGMKATLVGIEVEIVDMVYHHRELPIGAIGMGADMDVVLSHNRRCKKHQQRE